VLSVGGVFFSPFRLGFLGRGSVSCRFRSRSPLDKLMLWLDL
jgi:hypothetical protein